MNPIALNPDKMKKRYYLSALMIVLMACDQTQPAADSGFSVRLITLDPGHFHAALVQKTMYPEVDSVVHVYAPAGSDLDLHLGRIKGYNTRAQDPTHWTEEVYTGEDYLQNAIGKKVMWWCWQVITRRRPSIFFNRSKPGTKMYWPINPWLSTTEIRDAQKAFETAKITNSCSTISRRNALRSNTILQRELSMMPDVFGTLQPGTRNRSGCFHGQPALLFGTNMCPEMCLPRPAWFMDVSQQGAGIVDNKYSPG